MRRLIRLNVVSEVRLVTIFELGNLWGEGVGGMRVKKREAGGVCEVEAHIGLMS